MNTLRIAERCNIQLPFDSMLLRVIRPRRLVAGHLSGAGDPCRLQERLRRRPVSQKNATAAFEQEWPSSAPRLLGYFLIVWDFIATRASRTFR